MKLLSYILYLALVVTCSCEYKSYEPNYEGETHWLKSCEEGSACGNNGTCICGVCTTACQEDTDCKSHDKNAVCANSIVTSLSEGCSGEDISLSTNLCILPCERNDDCSIDDTDLVCAIDLCVDTDHQLAKQKSVDECPYNADFSCSDETPEEIVKDEEFLDENGCLLRRCTDEGDCLSGESCYISANYRDCYVALWQCQDYEIGEGCGCAIIDYEIPVACETGYCIAPKRVTRCTEKIDSDPVDVLDSFIEGDVVTITVGHSGGCATHGYGLCYSGNFNESDPVQTGLDLIHDANGENCEAYVTEVLHFDLTPLKETYQRAYRAESGVIETNFGLYGFESMSCLYRTLVADERIHQAEAKADKSCTSDDDCHFVTGSTGCYQSCGTIVSADGRKYLENRLSIVDESICKDVETDGCPINSPNCEPSGTTVCVEGKCSSSK